MVKERWSKTETVYSSAVEHYDDAYAADQTRDADLRGIANAWKFRPYVKEGDDILDFGCGNGSLLSVLGGKNGVEINPNSAKLARERGHDVRSTLGEWESSSFDTVISNHCLEHTEDPLSQLREIRRVIRDDGTLAICVPCHRADYPFKEVDRDFHLFSWSANNLGNLVRLAGFDVVAAHEIKHRWPPKWQFVLKRLGFGTFDLLSKIWGRLDRTASQVIVVAKPRVSD